MRGTDMTVCRREGWHVDAARATRPGMDPRESALGGDLHGAAGIVEAPKARSNEIDRSRNGTGLEGRQGSTRMSEEVAPRPQSYRHKKRSSAQNPSQQPGPPGPKHGW